MSKIITVKVNNTTTQTEVEEVFTVSDEATEYPIEIEYFLVEHVGERPTREERR